MPDTALEENYELLLGHWRVGSRDKTQEQMMNQLDYQIVSMFRFRYI
jgi:hypothetical protein